MVPRFRRKPSRISELEHENTQLKQQVGHLEREVSAKLQMKDQAMMEFVNKRIAEINTSIRRVK
jgi:hypothetical protein